MDFISVEMVGTVAGTCTTVAFVPQAWRIYKTKDTKSISLTMFIIFTSGLIFWIFFGILIHQLPVIIPNVVTLILASYILSMKIKNG